MHRNAALKFTAEQEAYLAPLFQANKKITPAVLCETMASAEQFKNREECLFDEAECKKFLHKLYRDERNIKGAKQCISQRSVHVLSQRQLLH